MPFLKNGFLEKIETWHVGLSCQYTHFMSFSSKSEHDTVADQATLKNKSMVRALLATAKTDVQYLGREEERMELEIVNEGNKCCTFLKIFQEIHLSKKGCKCRSVVRALLAQLATTNTDVCLGREGGEEGNWNY